MSYHRALEAQVADRVQILNGLEYGQLGSKLCKEHLIDYRSMQEIVRINIILTTPQLRLGMAAFTLALWGTIRAPLFSCMIAVCNPAH